MLQATDLDAGNVQYQFVQPSDTKFTIDSTSGLIRTTQPLDYNVQQQYILYVTTSDGVITTNPVATCTVTVIVQVRKLFNLITF